MPSQNIQTKLTLCNLNAVVAECDNRVPMDQVVCCKHTIPKGATVDCPYKISFDLNLTLTVPEGQISADDGTQQ